jgi:hypothetical protein
MRKAIPGFPGYEADEDGSIWSVGFANGREKKLKPGRSDNGYLVVRLARDGKYPTQLVHILVCTTFRGPRPSSEYEVRHLNGRNEDCRLENVIWGTASENQLDRRRHGTSPQGENHPKAIVTEEQVRDIRELLAAGYTTVAIAKRFGVNRYLISDIKRGRSWSYLK